MAFFFTADTHFGHERIIELCKRPFISVDEQTDGLIDRWNSVVSSCDHVFVVGDFAFKIEPPALRHIFNRLNGSKSLILGNHDQDYVKKSTMEIP